MKSNREKLSHAFEGLRGDTLQGVMTAMEAPTATRPRRARPLAILTAACLAVVLMLGALVAVPMLTARKGELPEGTENGVPVSDGGSFIASPDEDAPLLRVVVLSAEAEQGETNDSVSVDMTSSRIMLTFHCEAGETVEITSHRVLDQQTAVSEKLKTVLQEIQGADITETELKRLERTLYRELHRLGPDEDGWSTGSMTAWEPDGVITRISEQSFLVCRRLLRGSDPSDVVDFVIRNEAGEIVGAGSVCFVLKELYNAGMVRYEILGAKRFDTPATEAEVAAYVDGLHGTAEAVIAGLDFTPVTEEEGYAVAKTDLITACYGDARMLDPASAWTVSAASWEFRFFKAKGRGEDAERFFILFPDGSWGEIAEAGDWSYETCTDEHCGAEEAPAEHEHRTRRTLVLTDGRTVLIERHLYEGENGGTSEKFVPVFSPEAVSA